jgi:hypothetical protein
MLPLTGPAPGPEIAVAASKTSGSKGGSTAIVPNTPNTEPANWPTTPPGAGPGYGGLKPGNALRPRS